MVGDYGQRLRDNNINGTVLLSCDLAELKPVLQMAFGDWVLFRSLVELLRYSEQNAESSDGEVSTPMETFVRSTAAINASTIGAKNISTAAVTVGVANSVTSSSKKATSDTTVTSVSNTDATSAGPSRSSPTLKDLLPAVDRDVTDDIKSAVTTSPKIRPHPPFSRQDSFVDEVMMESEALRGFIQASVVGSDSEGGTGDSDDEVQRPITTIPEETTVVSRNTSASSLGRMSQRQVSVIRRMSIESGPMDRAFSVGPDQDSGSSDSDDDRISRKNSMRVHVGTGATHGSAEERRKELSSKSMKQSYDSYRASLKSADKANKSKSTTRLDVGGSESFTPLMSLYFPTACDHSHMGSSSYTSSYVPAKPPSGTTVCQTSIPSGSSPRQSDASSPVNDSERLLAAVGLSSGQNVASASSGPQPQPPSSAIVTCANNLSLSQQMSQSTESAEVTLESDDVKFFIEDECDPSPKAIMVEMDALPPHRVSSSVTTDTSHHDPDHVVL